MKNTLFDKFVRYVTDLAANNTMWNLSCFESIESIVNMPKYLMKGYVELSKEQNATIFFAFVPNLPNDLIVKISRVCVNCGILEVYIYYPKNIKRKRPDRQIKAVKRKLERMSPFNYEDVVFIVRYDEHTIE